MFIKLKNQKEIIYKAIKKAGSYRALAKITKIPRSSLVRYVKNQSMLKDRLNIILNFLNYKLNKKDIEFLQPDNWRQIKGGKGCVESKKKKGTFEKEMKKWQDFQAKKLKRWHKFMRKNKPEEYYLTQYSRFKKVCEYKFKTKNGELVRNSLERDIANIFHDLNIAYKYEPLIHIGKKYFFPDFLINDKIIVECTMWKGVKKAYSLRDKIRILEKKYKVIVVIPKSLYRYYEILDNHLSLLDEFVPVAQTFQSKS